MIALPTQDEFDSWRLHPVTQFVALAYQNAAERQRVEWRKYFDAPTIPAELAAIRLELKTREDAYRAFLESTLVDFIALADPESIGAPNGRRPTSPRPIRSRQTAGY